MNAVDQQVRDRALDTHGSFAVSAPAGSGKTGLLIRRILRLLSTCENSEQVLAITFTRKAAAEMQERVITALQQAATGPEPDNDYDRATWQNACKALARDKSQGWQLLANPSRLRIMTIDSLNRYLARQLILETGLGELPEPAEQPETLYRQAVQHLFAELETTGPQADALALLLSHLDNNLASLENLLITLLAQREQWLGPLISSHGARQTLEQVLRNVIEDGLASARNHLQPVAGELVDLCDYAAANLVNLRIDSPLAPLAGITDLPGITATSGHQQQWQGLSHLLLTNADDWRKPGGINKKLGFPTAKESTQPERAADYKEKLATLLAWCKSQPGLLASLVDLRNLPGPAYSDQQWQLLDALTRLLPRLAAELSLVFAEQRSCDFTEVTLAALNALGDENNVSQLALRLDYRIQHILVDEFQDTSTLQFNLLKKLLAGWQTDDGRTLFIVGDGMQSLYGFRNANVGLFLEALQAPVNQVVLQPLELQSNFRSDPAIVDWVNHLFVQVFPPHEDISRGAVPYAPAQAAKPRDENAAVTLDVFDGDSTPVEEASQVIERIRAARLADPTGSIAILTRARSQLQTLLPALRDAGIPWTATEIDPLASRMPVLDLLSLTRALLNPADRIAWLSVLRAPWCGLDLKDLHALANPNNLVGTRGYPWLPRQLANPEAWQGLSPLGQQAITRVAEVLNSARQQRHRRPLRLSVEAVWLALGGPAILANGAEMDWCQQYLNLLESHDCGGEIPDWYAFEQAAERLYAAPANGLDNPVQIMTIHKSKGLEFDTVIMPGLHRSSGKNDPALLYWRERLDHQGNSQLLIAPPLSPEEQGSSTEDSLLVNHLKHEARLKGQLEDARVLYVGCTRAIKRLHLLFTYNGKAPASNSLLGCLWPALEIGFDQGGATVCEHTMTTPANTSPESEMDEPSSEGRTRLLRLKPDWRNPIKIGSQHQASVTTVPPQPRGSGNDELRHLGTVLHRTLRQVVMEGTDSWNQQRLERQLQAWRLQLSSLLGTEPSETLIALLEKAVRSTLADSDGLWVLNNKHSQSACELPIAHRNALGEPVLSVIDRVFVNDGTLWIVDYKTSMPTAGESIDAFLARETHQYQEQLQRYRQAMEHQYPGAIKTALYFPLLPCLHSVE